MIKLAILSSVLLFSSPALPGGEDRVTTTVVDVGAGLCTITKITSGNDKFFVLYDAGAQSDKDDICLKAVGKVVGDSSIDLMIIGHPDLDHINEADEIIKRYKVSKLFRVGVSTDKSKEWGKKPIDELEDAIKNSRDRIKKEIKSCVLSHAKKQKIRFGNATIDIMLGICPEIAGERNEASILARISLGNYSILFTGDAEASTIKRAKENKFPLIASVLIVPHHGGRTGGLDPQNFVSEKYPQNQYLVFPAGQKSKHGHPKKDVVDSYHKKGIPYENMYRTDFGGKAEDIKKKKAREWEACKSRDASAKSDKPGDDDIVITWTDKEASRLKVKYKNGQKNTCPSR